MRSGYREIANRRRTIPGEVALGMLDKNVEVLKVETEVSPEFVLRSELDESEARSTRSNRNRCSAAPASWRSSRGAKRASWDS